MKRNLLRRSQLKNSQQLLNLRQRSPHLLPLSQNQPRQNQLRRKERRRREREKGKSQLLRERERRRKEGRMERSKRSRKERERKKRERERVRRRKERRSHNLSPSVLLHARRLVVYNMCYVLCVCMICTMFRISVAIHLMFSTYKLSFNVSLNC